MRAGSMCLWVLQEPRWKILSSLGGNYCHQPFILAGFWSEKFHTIRSPIGSSSGSKLLRCKCEPSNEGLKRRWSFQPITKKTEGRKSTTKSTKPCNLNTEFLDGTVTASTNLNLNKSEQSELLSIRCRVQQNLESKDLSQLVPVFVFDLETTGFSREKERIIEIAFRYLLGGENSTLQSLVNPKCHVPNSHVHGITTHMVYRPDVPGFEDLIPILKHFVRSRQKPGLPAVFVAHNARCFDVPFLMKEFSRCSMEIPEDWLFIDTLPLAREVMKADGLKASSRISLQALRDYYHIPLVGSAHRAMSDVNLLALILQRLTFDLKLPVSGLLERSFRASDLINSKKKNAR